MIVKILQIYNRQYLLRWKIYWRLLSSLKNKKKVNKILNLRQNHSQTFPRNSKLQMIGLEFLTVARVRWHCQVLILTKSAKKLLHLRVNVNRLVTNRRNQFNQSHLVYSLWVLKQSYSWPSINLFTVYRIQALVSQRHNSLSNTTYTKNSIWNTSMMLNKIKRQSVS